jgi:hypothetical protein
MQSHGLQAQPPHAVVAGSGAAGALSAPQVVLPGVLLLGNPDSAGASGEAAHVEVAVRGSEP